MNFKKWREHNILLWKGGETQVFGTQNLPLFRYPYKVGLIFNPPIGPAPQYHSIVETEETSHCASFCYQGPESDDIPQFLMHLLI